MEKNMKNIKIVPYLNHISRWIIQHGYDEKIMDLIIDQCILAASNKQCTNLLADVFQAAQEKYESGMNRRKVFNRLMDLSPQQLANATQHGLLCILSEIKTSNHPIRLKGKEWLEQLVVRLETDVSLQQSIEPWIQKNIIDKFKLREQITQIIITIYNGNVMDNRLLVRGMESLISQFDILIADFTDNQEEKRKLDVYLKNIMNKWIDEHHDEIGRIVKDSLNQFTNEKLVSFIEDKNTIVFMK